MFNSNQRPAPSINEQISLLEFQGSKIAFQEIDGKLMVNATQMARPFNKRTRDWLRTQQANDLLKAVSDAHMCASADLQYVRKGGKNQGTWFQKDVALLFAQWLSPEFYVACNRKLEELIQQQALLLQEPVKYGIEGIIKDGKAFYPYTKACKLLGKIKYPRVNTRKSKNPDHFIKAYGRNFVTEVYLDLLKGYYDYKLASNQLKLEL